MEKVNKIKIVIFFFYFFILFFVCPSPLQSSCKQSAEIDIVVTKINNIIRTVVGGVWSFYVNPVLFFFFYSILFYFTSPRCHLNTPSVPFTSLFPTCCWCSGRNLLASRCIVFQRHNIYIYISIGFFFPSQRNTSQN